MQPSDITIEILRGIRDEIGHLRRDTNARFASLELQVSGLREGLEHVDGRIDETNRRLVATEVRLSTELVAVVGAVHEVRDLLREDLALRGRVEDHERRLSAVEARLG